MHRVKWRHSNMW